MLCRTSSVGILITRHPDQCSRNKIVRRASSRKRSSQTIGYLCIIQLTQLRAAERSMLTPLPFVWRRAVLQKSSSHKSVFLPASSMDMGCAAVDVIACSISVDTSLYPVTLPGRSSRCNSKPCNLPSLRCNCDCNRPPCTCHSFRRN